MLDRMEVRRAVGEAGKRIIDARRAHFEAISKRRDALFEEKRQLQDKLGAIQDEINALHDGGKDEDAVAVVRAAAHEHPDLRIYEFGDEPMVCQATGLAIFEGDATYGDPEYGAVLVAVVDVIGDPVNQNIHDPNA